MLTANDYQLTDADFQLVRDVVYKHCGISLSEEKKALVRARITRQLRAGNFSSAKEYLDHVLANRDGRAFEEFIDSISTNLTSFFRENDHFKYLSEISLPAILARKQEMGDGRLLAWSAACSTGEEPYSLSITLLEATSRVSAAPLKWDIRVLATDISTRVLAAARTGIYDASRLSSVPSVYRSRYFSRIQNRADPDPYEVSPDLRAVVRFRHLNLMDAWPFKGPFDFIFCRNVMIYFDKGTQQKLVDRFWNCLQPGGLLFTGHSESLTGIVHRFERRRSSIYEKSAS